MIFPPDGRRRRHCSARVFEYVGGPLLGKRPGIQFQSGRTHFYHPLLSGKEIVDSHDRGGDSIGAVVHGHHCGWPQCRYHICGHTCVNGVETAHRDQQHVHSAHSRLLSRVQWVAQVAEVHQAKPGVVEHHDGVLAASASPRFIVLGGNACDGHRTYLHLAGVDGGNGVSRYRVHGTMVVVVVAGEYHVGVVVNGCVR